MNRNKLFVIMLVSITAIAAMFLVWRILNPMLSNPAAISNKITSTTPQQVSSTSLSAAASTSVRQGSVRGEYIINAPNALILVDSQGRRTGKDPTSGTTYHEIPGTSYVEEATSPGHANGELFVSNLANGPYTLYVVGGQTGHYAVDASYYGQPHQLFSGDIQAGFMIAFAQNYDSTNLASSTFLLYGTASTTAKITSIPPHDLP